MALYRNIAGIDGPGQVGLTLREQLDKARSLFQVNTSEPTDLYQPTTYQPIPVGVTDTGATFPTASSPLSPTSTAPTPGAQTALPTGTTDEALSTSQAQSTATVQTNLLPLALLAGLTFLSISGDRVLPKRKRLVYLLGLGGLYYSIAKNQI